MTNPHQRTHGRRRLPVRLPSGRRTLHFEPRAPAKAQCSRCGKELHGVPTFKPLRYSRSARAPSRPFGGVLCPNCLSTEVRALVRSSSAST
jgi:large subunit ribosomal protein L34e